MLRRLFSHIRSHVVAFRLTYMVDKTRNVLYKLVSSSDFGRVWQFCIKLDNWCVFSPTTFPQLVVDIFINICKYYHQFGFVHRGFTCIFTFCFLTFSILQRNFDKEKAIYNSKFIYLKILDALQFISILLHINYNINQWFFIHIFTK